MKKNGAPAEKKSFSFVQLISQRFPRARKYLTWLVRIAVVIFLLDTGYLMGIWPNWDWIASGPIPKSRFIQNYEMLHEKNPTTPTLRWATINFDKIPHTMINAVLAAEDFRFFKHSGIDTDALINAIEYNWNKKSIVYGASTISQQTIKNLYLSDSRNPLRKWHEYLLTLAMEQNLSKKRILEIYLNVAEFGRGVYGIEAAAQKYWGISASQLSKQQAIELAATLPAPAKHNPQTRTAFFIKQRDKIAQNM